MVDKPQIKNNNNKKSLQKTHGGYTMESKINAAIAYVQEHIGAGPDKTMVKNDAANIFSSSYNEYMKIWEVLNNI